MPPVLQLLIGLPLLLVGGHFLATGAGALALRLRIPQLTVGLTIVAMGTSAPELAVSLLAAMRSSPDIAMGNVIGSNIANLLLILGAVGVLRPLTLTTSIRWREIPFMLLSIIVLAALVNDAFLSSMGSGTGPDVLGRGEGVALIGFFAVYLYYVVSVARSSGMQAEEEVTTLSLPVASLMTVGGLIALIAGGRLTVSGASGVALAMGASEALVGLTIVAIGTSLPELVTSLAAARQGNADLAVGNVVGSNIFNIFWILGVSSTISPVPFNTRLNADLGVLAAGTLLFFLFTYTGRRHTVDRGEAALFLLMYAAYVGYLAVRG